MGCVPIFGCLVQCALEGLVKIISDIEACPACGSESLQRVPRSGREDWVFDRVYVCANCLERSGRVPPGKTTLLVRIMNFFNLI